jgi:hypothetical protein
MNRAAFVTVAAAVVLTILLVLMTGNTFTGQYRFPKDAAERAIGVSTALLAITVFVERALAVALDPIVASEEPGLREQLILAPPRNLGAELTKITKLQRKREDWRILLGVVLGLILALAGVRTLANLLEVQQTAGFPPPSSFQSSLFAGLDILVTAGLIAGGSAGIAGIIAYWKNRSLFLLMRYRQDLKAK